MMIILVTVLRHKLSPLVKAMFFVIFQSAVAVMGVLSFGLLAPSLIFLPMIVVILALFFSPQPDHCDVFAGVGVCGAQWLCFSDGILAIAGGCGCVVHQSLSLVSDGGWPDHFFCCLWPSPSFSTVNITNS
jgi:hypothetical protein